MRAVPEYAHTFNRQIRLFLGEALRITLRDPGMAAFVARTLWHQNRAMRVREGWAERGVHVPAFMIASVTSRCNLNCKGCYSRAQGRHSEPEMSPEKLRGVVEEARDLGVSIIMVAGGEPLTRPEVLDIAAGCPEVLFPLFTNGLLLDDGVLQRLGRLRNVVPILSVEGHQVETDARRGMGVHAHILETMRRLRDRGVFFGTSLTVTSHNLELVTGEEFVADLVGRGCKLFFYVDYVPVQPGTEALELSARQRAIEAERLVALRGRERALFLAFPGDEELYGGCLAAGRGFVHVSPSGRLEPCPFSPYSDVSLNDVPLSVALQSPLLRTIRESGEHLSEHDGGCALWERRGWVESLLQARAPAEVEGVPVA